MADGNGSSSLHIVVFPWLAFGHMLPFLELSKSLARRGHRISFISTPRNIQRLPKPPPQLSHLITFIPFNLPQTEGLPEFAEATSDLPAHDVPYLKKAFDGVEQPISEFIKQATPKPDWIIQDFAQYWMTRIAAASNIPCIFLVIFKSSTLAFLGPTSEYSSERQRTTPEQYTSPPPWVPFPSKVAFRLHEARSFSGYCCETNISGVTDMYRMRAVVESCTAVTVRSSMEVESEWLDLLPQIYKKLVIPVGLLLPEPDPRIGEDGKKIMDWLDEQRPRSVVYVAFGSEFVLTNELMCELARGMELSKVPFLWALRVGALPEGFEERTRDHGIVAKGWVPQLKILAHESVGGFLTHMGWSSVIEGLQFGRPLIMLPIFIDHGLTARAMAGMGVGIEVERDEEDGSFTKEAVARALRLVMVDEEGESYRKQANEMRKVFGDRECQEKYVDGLIQYMKNRPSIRSERMLKAIDDCNAFN